MVAPRSPVSTVAIVSGLYDTVAGAFFFVLAGGLLSPGGHLAAAFTGADRLARIIGIPPSDPRIFSDLNALFLIAIGLGYYLPWRHPHTCRGYMWVMGVGLKTAGAAAFVLDYLLRDSPSSLLLFAASDAAIAAVTLKVLMATRGDAEPT